jgi:DNA-binding transcriptional LysR family regulator
MKSSDTTLSYHSVRAGMGAAFLPGWLVDDDLAAGRLVKMPRKGPPLIGELQAVYTSRRQMPPKLRSFIDFLRMRLGDEV